MFRPLTALAALTVALALPMAAAADKPAHAGQNGHGKAKIERKVKTQQNARGDKPRQARKAVEREGRRVTSTRPVVVSDPTPVVVPGPTLVQARNCPPGLAKKDPACIPPGQAKKAGLVGSVIDWDDVHLISRPGLYGLSEPPAGQRYAVIDGRLVRVDRTTGKILSIIRLVDAILD